VAQCDHSVNLILASLGTAELNALAPYLKSFDLPQQKVLFDAGDEIDAIYFPRSGIVSLVVSLASGEMVETAMIGTDGAVGAAAAISSKTALTRAVVQLAGSASVLAVDRFCALADRNVAFHDTLMHHEQFLLAQAQQSAACNATHTVEARLARWLLRCRDLAGRDDLDLTQEYLAQMLAVRRTSVSIVAHTLQQAGLIKYRRGHIHLLNIDGLRESACECYETVKSRGVLLLGPPPASV
jgi:CRP-like cAMP-binding protein